MRKIVRHQAWLAGIVMLTLLPACASQNMANRTAREAHRQLQATIQAVDRKNQAENRYYDQIISITRESFRRNRSEELLTRKTQLGRAFVRSYDAAKQDAESHRVTMNQTERLMTTAVDQWSSREKQRRDAMEQSLGDLADNRRKLEQARKQITQLSNQLTVLSKAQSAEALFRFLSDYAKSLKKEYDRLGEEAKKAETGANDANPAAPKPGPDAKQ